MGRTRIVDVGTGGQTDGRTDGRTDGLTDGHFVDYMLRFINKGPDTIRAKFV